MESQKGFTLLELMIVIVILGVLAALLSGNFVTSLKKGRDAQRKADLEHIQRALELYYEDKKTYPTFDIFANSNYQLCETNIYANCTSKSEKSYMEKIPDDSNTNTKYKYYYTTGQNYGLYACLENSQQILPYLSTPGNYGSSPALTCGIQCFAPDGSTKTTCIWGLSDSNSTP